MKIPEMEIFENALRDDGDRRKMFTRPARYGGTRDRTLVWFARDGTLVGQQRG